MSRTKKFTAFTIDNVEIIDAATDGRGVASYEDKKIFTEFVVPGDEAEIYVFQKVKRLFSGTLRKINKPSPHRVAPICKHFGTCGGCKWQMMTYEAQLSYKTKQVRDIFARVGKIPGEVKSALPSLSTTFYRNKLEFSFGTKLWVPFEQKGLIEQNQPALGFHGRGSFDKILNVEECHLQLPIIAEILNELRAFAIAQEIPFYNIRAHEGFLREAMFRNSVATGELMLLLNVKYEKQEWIDAIFTHLSEKFPAITHLTWIVNPKMNTSFNDLPFQVWKGQGFITEKLGEYQFRISPTSFFQTNPTQAKRLYDVVKDMLESVLPEGQTRHKTVYDLYTGTGSIAIYVSSLAEKIVGIEYVESSIRDAKINTEINGLSHLHFYAGDMAKVLTDELIEKEGKPDIIITDPARAGMAPAVIQQILKVMPEYVIYVSCHPATQARDADMMRNHYEMCYSQPVDMFPHTAHLENVALFKRREVVLNELYASERDETAEETEAEA